jgi:hypothetical protein
MKSTQGIHNDITQATNPAPPTTATVNSNHTPNATQADPESTAHNTPNRLNNQPNANPHTPVQQIHKALTGVWQACFSGQTHAEPEPAVLPANLQLAINIPWGPDPHEIQADDSFRIYFQNMYMAFPE